MGAEEEEYEGGPDQLADKLADLDDELAEQRAAALRAGSPTTSWTRRTPSCSPASSSAKTASSSFPRCPSWPSSAARTSASRRW